MMQRGTYLGVFVITKYLQAALNNNNNDIMLQGCAGHGEKGRKKSSRRIKCFAVHAADNKGRNF